MAITSNLALPAQPYDIYAKKDGNNVVILDNQNRQLTKRKCLGQAIMDVLEWLIDKKAETGDKLVKIVLGPYKFQVTEQPIIVIDFFKKFSTAYPYYQTGIAIVGSEPMTHIECQGGLPTFLTFENSNNSFPYMNCNIFLDKLFIRLPYAKYAVVDIINVGSLFVGDLTIDAEDSKIGFRAIFSTSG